MILLCAPLVIADGHGGALIDKRVLGPLHRTVCGGIGAPVLRRINGSVSPLARTVTGDQSVTVRGQLLSVGNLLQVARCRLRSAFEQCLLEVEVVLHLP